LAAKTASKDPTPPQTEYVANPCQLAAQRKVDGCLVVDERQRIVWGHGSSSIEMEDPQLVRVVSG
jgi:hypothetical protein